MPTFNKNKRPHQALIAHPNNVKSNNARYQAQGCLPSSASNYGPNKRPHNDNKSQITSLPSQPINCNRAGQSWNGSSNNNNSAFFQSNIQENYSASSFPSPWNPSSTPSTSASTRGFAGSIPPPGPPPSSLSSSENINSSWQKWAGVNNTGPSRSHTTHMMGAPQFGCGPYQQASINPGYPHQQEPINPGYPHQQAPINPGYPHQQPSFSSGAPRPSCWKQNTNRPPPNVFPPHQTVRPNPSNFQVSGNVMAKKKQQQDVRFVVDDRSLKVLTASLGDVRNWSQHIDKAGVMIFEVFGMMNSAVSSDISGVAKKFTLKDQDQTLKCIFYETDRPLPRLSREQWLRCMGSLDHRNGLFRCVSVRPASPAEQKVMTTLVATSSSIMKERLAALQEP